MKQKAPTKLIISRLPFPCLLLAITILLPAIPATAKSHHFNGAAALADTRRATAFGERPSGSEALNGERSWLETQLRSLGGELTEDSFTGQTPNGPLPMVNLLLRFSGTSGASKKTVAITGHYDTKRIAMTHFVGANDGGSSAGFLLEFARTIAGEPHADDIVIVFFDGEEAVGEWSATDSLYGSRHLAEKWGSDGTLARLRALINVDMIGDKDLDITNEANSSQGLRDLVFSVAAKLGDSAYFRKPPSAVDDDHMPFVDRGVNAIDLIDFDYGPSDHTYWHTGADTMDKLGAHSFQVVGDVVDGVVATLEHE